MKLIYIEIINVKIEILPKFIFIKLAFIMKSTTSLKPQHKKCYLLKSRQYLLYIFQLNIPHFATKTSSILIKT